MISRVASTVEQLDTMAYRFAPMIEPSRVRSRDDTDSRFYDRMSLHGNARVTTWSRTRNDHAYRDRQTGRPGRRRSVTRRYRNEGRDTTNSKRVALAPARTPATVRCEVRAACTSVHSARRGGLSPLPVNLPRAHGSLARLFPTRRQVKRRCTRPLHDLQFYNLARLSCGRTRSRNCDRTEPPDLFSRATRERDPMLNSRDRIGSRIFDVRSQLAPRADFTRHRG